MTLFYDFDDTIHSAINFEYELNEEQEKKAVEFISQEFAKKIKARASETDLNITKAIIQAFICDNNLEEATMEQWQDELEDYFYDEAQQDYAEILNDIAEYGGTYGTIKFNR